MMPFFYNEKPHRLQGFRCTCGVWERAVADERDLTYADFNKAEKAKDRSQVKGRGRSITPEACQNEGCG
jgi:hypothetical protein